MSLAAVYKTRNNVSGVSIKNKETIAALETLHYYAEGLFLEQDDILIQK